MPIQSIPSYDPRSVAKLFDEMAATYGMVNLVSSFGFTVRWRRQCLGLLSVRPGLTAIDLMSGMGELCSGLAKRLDGAGQIIAIDISSVMCEKARDHAKRNSLDSLIRVIRADATQSPIADESVEVVVSTFGLKTFDVTQIRSLAEETERILRPGGQFAMLEISVPGARWIRLPYMFYLERVIPMIGRILLGNPDHYRMLGVYTKAFGDCRAACKIFSDAGLETSFRSFFGGCATAIMGTKPSRAEAH